MIMMLCTAGDAHGALDRLYADVLDLERAIGVSFDWVLHVGDFGIWPDPDRVDKATRHHDGAGDFPRWIADAHEAPRRTVFIKGNHEDFEWLDARPTREVHPGLHYLRNGEVFELTARGEILRVGGIGGCHGPSNFERPSGSLAGYSKRHYTRDEIEKLGTRADLDIVMTHDAPKGVRFPKHRRGEGFESVAAGLDDLLARTKPRVCFFGHHHTRLDAQVAGVPCVGLNKVARPGNLVALEMSPGGRGYVLLGEWPHARD